MPKKLTPLRFNKTKTTLYFYNFTNSIYSVAQMLAKAISGICRQELFISRNHEFRMFAEISKSNFKLELFGLQFNLQFKANYQS